MLVCVAQSVGFQNGIKNSMDYNSGIVSSNSGPDTYSQI